MLSEHLYSQVQSLTYKSRSTAKEELLDEHLGVTVLSLVTKDGSEELRRALIDECSYDMEEAPVIQKVYQDFSQKRHYKNSELLLVLKKKIEEEILGGVYEKFHLSLSKNLFFEFPNLQKYEYVEGGNTFAIPPHVDYKACVEVIAILLLEGPPLFYIAEDRECNGETGIEASVMDIILMRGYRFQGVEKRPLHYIKKVPKGVRRVTLGFRMMGENQTDIDNMERALHGP